MALNWAALIRPQVTDDMQSRLEWFEERAAIMEFDAGMTRAEAEAAALRLVYTDVPCLRAERRGGDFQTQPEGHLDET